MQVLLISVLLVLATLAAAFGLTALTIWLSTLFGAAIAFAIVAAGFLVLAVAVQVAVTIHRQRRKRAASPLLGSAGETSDQAAFGSIAAFALIGYLLGRRVERH